MANMAHEARPASTREDSRVLTGKSIDIRWCSFSETSRNILDRALRVFGRAVEDERHGPCAAELAD